MIEATDLANTFNTEKKENETKVNVKEISTLV